MPPAYPDDEVDLLIDAWGRRLPDVDLTPLDVMSRLRRASLRLARLRAEAFRTAGLSSWEFDVLAALGRASAPHELTATQLVDLTMIGSAAMTNRLTNLTERGFITRMPNPNDGRSVLVRLTDDGAAHVDAAMTELVRREAIELHALTAADRAALVKLLRVLTAGER